MQSQEGDVLVEEAGRACALSTEVASFWSSLGYKTCSASGILSKLGTLLIPAVRPECCCWTRHNDDTGVAQQVRLPTCESEVPIGLD